MQNPPVPADETERLATLRDLRLVELARQMDFERHTRLARSVARAAYSLVLLVEEHEVIVATPMPGLPASADRAQTLTAFTIANDGPLWIADAATERLTCAMPSVATPPYLRFYCGAPIIVRGR